MEREKSQTVSSNTVDYSKAKIEILYLTQFPWLHFRNLWHLYIKFIFECSCDPLYFAKHWFGVICFRTKRNQNVCETVNASTGFLSHSLRNHILPLRQAILGNERICVMKSRELWLENKPKYTEALRRGAGMFSLWLYLLQENRVINQSPLRTNSKNYTFPISAPFSNSGNYIIFHVYIQNNQRSRVGRKGNFTLG